MVAPVENVEFALFEKSMAPQWQAVKSQFMNSNENIKDATRELIDVSFRSGLVHVVIAILLPCSVLKIVATMMHFTNVVTDDQQEDNKLQDILLNSPCASNN